MILLKRNRRTGISIVLGCLVAIALLVASIGVLPAVGQDRGTGPLVQLDAAPVALELGADGWFAADLMTTVTVFSGNATEIVLTYDIDTPQSGPFGLWIDSIKGRSLDPATDTLGLFSPVFDWNEAFIPLGEPHPVFDYEATTLDIERTLGLGTRKLVITYSGTFPQGVVLYAPLPFSQLTAAVLGCEMACDFTPTGVVVTAQAQEDRQPGPRISRSVPVFPLGADIPYIEPIYVYPQNLSDTVSPMPTLQWQIENTYLMQALQIQVAPVGQFVQVYDRDGWFRDSSGALTVFPQEYSASEAEADGRYMWWLVASTAPISPAGEAPTEDLFFFGPYYFTVDADATPPPTLVPTVSVMTSTPLPSNTPTPLPPPVTVTPMPTLIVPPTVMPTAVSTDPTRLSYGQAVEGVIPDGDLNVWTFEGQAGDVISILMESEAIDPVLRLLDPAGNLLAEDDDGGEGLNAYIEGYELPTDGLYMIFAESFGDGGGPYTLRLEQTVYAPSGSINIGETVTAYLADESQSWTFAGSAGQVVTIALNSDEFDTYLVLLGPDGEQLTWDDDSGGDLNATITGFELPADGTYTIQATSFTGSARGNYTLSLQEGVAPPEVEGELFYGDEASGVLGLETMPRWQFFGLAGDMVTIALDSQDFDAYVELYGPSDELLTENDDGGPGLNALIENFELPTDGMYTIVVRSFAPSASGDYTLSLALGSAVEGVLLYGDVMADTLDDATDRWTFEGNAGDMITIALSSDDFDPYLELLGADDEWLASDDDGAGDLNALLEAYVLPADGLYTIVVTSYSGEGTGAYVLVLEETEFEITGTISFGVAMTDVALETGRDYWAFEGEAGDLVSISLSSEEFDTYLELRGPTGTVLTEDDDSGGDLDSRIAAFELPESGQYLIVVRGYYSDAAGNYTLSLDQPTLSTPGALEYGDDVVAVMDGADQEWTFEAAARDVVTIQLNSSAFDPYLELRGPDGEIVAENDDWNGLNAAIYAQFLPQAGDYTIVVRSFSMRNAGAYQLSLAQIPTSTMGEIDYGDTVTGTLEGNRHYWLLKGNTGDLVSVVLESADFDAYLELLSPAGETLITDDDGAGELNAFIDGYTLQSGGTYLIVARSLSDTASGDYSLTVTQPVVTPMGALTYGETAAGVLDDDRHYWTFEAAANDVVTIEVTSTAFDTHVELLDPDGAALYTPDPYGYYYPEDESSMDTVIEELHLPQAGEYTIVVRSLQMGASGDYTLSLTQVETTPPGALDFGDEVLSYLDDDSAEWTFEGQADDIVTIAMSSAWFDTYLELVGPTGAMLAYDDDGGGDLDSLITAARLPETGEYTIVARAYSSGASGTYRLSLSRLSESQLRTLDFELPAEGYLEGVRDLWRFQGQAGQLVTIRVGSDAFNTYVELMSPTGTMLVSNDDGGSGLNSQITAYALPEDGQYLLVVRSSDQATTGPYTISIQTVEISQPGPLQYGDEVTSYLDADRHEWTFDALTNDSVTISMRSSEFDTYLELIGPDGQQVTYNDDGGGNLNSLIDSFRLTQPGQYTIVARGYSDGASGAYTLSLSATSITPMGTLAYGDVVSAELNGGRQYWSFEGVAGEMVNISLQSEDFDTYLELLGPSGTELLTDDDGGEGLNSLIASYELPESGEYTIVARGLNLQSVGTYTLSLEVGVTPEGNSGVIALDGTIEATLTAGANDEWEFEAPAGQAISITANSDEFDTYLELYGPAGTQLIYDDDGGPETNSAIGAFVLPESGNYTILVRGFSRDMGGAYTLELMTTSVTEPGTLVFGDEALGVLPNGEQHRWTFEGSAGDVVNIALSSDLFDTYLLLEGPSGETLIEDDDSGADLNALIGLFTLPEDGVYTIVVRGYRDTAGGAYTLTLNLADDLPETSAEPALPMGNVTYGDVMQGTLMDNRHAWTLAGDEGDVVSIALDSEDFDPVLVLLGPDGTELARDDDSGEGLNAFIDSYSLPTSGDYTIVVRSFWESVRGDYTLSLPTEPRPVGAMVK